MEYDLDRNAALVVKMGEGNLAHAGWLDEHDRIWGVQLRNGAVPTDRKLYVLVPANEPADD